MDDPAAADEQLNYEVDYEEETPLSRSIETRDVALDSRQGGDLSTDRHKFSNVAVMSTDAPQTESLAGKNTDLVDHNSLNNGDAEVLADGVDQVIADTQTGGSVGVDYIALDSFIEPVSDAEPASYAPPAQTEGDKPKVQGFVQANGHALTRSEGDEGRDGNDNGSDNKHLNGGMEMGHVEHGSNRTMASGDQAVCTQVPDYDVDQQAEEVKQAADGGDVNHVVDMEEDRHDVGDADTYQNVADEDRDELYSEPEDAAGREVEHYAHEGGGDAEQEDQPTDGNKQGTCRDGTAEREEGEPREGGEPTGEQEEQGEEGAERKRKREKISWIGWAGKEGGSASGGCKGEGDGKKDGERKSDSRALSPRRPRRSRSPRATVPASTRRDPYPPRRGPPPTSRPIPTPRSFSEPRDRRGDPRDLRTPPRPAAFDNRDRGYDRRPRSPVHPPPYRRELTPPGIRRAPVGFRGGPGGPPGYDQRPGGWSSGPPGFRRPGSPGRGPMPPPMHRDTYREPIPHYDSRRDDMRRPDPLRRGDARDPRDFRDPRDAPRGDYRDMRRPVSPPRYNGGYRSRSPRDRSPPPRAGPHDRMPPPSRGMEGPRGPHPVDMHRRPSPHRGPPPHRSLYPPRDSRPSTQDPLGPRGHSPPRRSPRRSGPPYGSRPRSPPPSGTAWERPRGVRNDYAPVRQHRPESPPSARQRIDGPGPGGPGGPGPARGGYDNHANGGWERGSNFRNGGPPPPGGPRREDGNWGGDRGDRREWERGAAAPRNASSPPRHANGYGNTGGNGSASGSNRPPQSGDLMFCEWFYIDPDNNKQGPCSISQFRSWMTYLSSKQQFEEEAVRFRKVLVWKENGSEKCSLEELLQRTANLT